MRTALITGATGGIGEAVAKRLSQDGYDLVLQYHSNEKKAMQLAEELHAVAVGADLRSEEEVRLLFSVCPKLDLLVNCAGVAQQKLFTDITLEDWDFVIDTNLRGVFLCCREAVKKMVSHKAGCIINISSMWGQVGASCEAHYAASKAGVISLTQSLAKELAPSHIRVNCVAPGLIDTPMNAHLSREEIRALIEEIPLARQGTGKDVAGAVSFLASEDAQYITGQTLTVDGGMTL